VIGATDPEVLAGGIRALNRGLADFCGADKRMGGVGYLRLADGPDSALAQVETIAALGLPAVLVDSLPPPGGMGFSHPAYDPVWARLQDLGLAVTLHIGARGAPYEPVPRAVFNNGRETPVHRNGDAPADAVSYMGMPFEAQVFLSAMIFDGVLERFPRLRIAVVELGASWVVSFLKHLDQSFRAFRRRQDFSALTCLPSEYMQRQVKVTPFAGEDIGWLLSSGAADMLMFASDYPHHEGTDDPIGRYERTLAGTGEPLRENFYHRNFEALFADRKWW
jgi:predicted TIM-barrel fold metal-dependent hydrolase